MYLYFFIVPYNLSQFCKIQNIFVATAILADNRYEAAYLVTYNGRMYEVEVFKKFTNRKLN